VGEPVYRKASAIALKQHEMSLDPLAHIAPKLEELGADDFPVLLGAVLHMMELGAFR
jgi:hypothetical protein